MAQPERWFVGKFNYPKGTTNKGPFVRNLVGGLTGNRAVFSDFRGSKPWQQVIFTYVLFFLINIGLLFLFTSLFLPGIFDALLGELWIWLVLLVFLHLVVWLLRIVIYHALCKIARGAATIQSAMVASGFVYPLSSIFLLTLCIAALFMKNGWYSALLIPTFLIAAVLLWRAFVIIRGASALYNIPARNTFIMLAIVLLFMSLVATLLYVLVTGYVAGIQAELVAAGGLV